MYPVVILKNHKRVLAGYPWIYSNEIDLTGSAKSIPPGSLVTIKTSQNQFLGIGYFNAHSLITIRLLSATNEIIDSHWIKNSIEKALALRNSYYPMPYYRLIHTEADNLPGIIIDRYGYNFVVELNTAGADLLQDNLTEALLRLFPTATIIFKKEQPIRKLEQIPIENSSAESRIIIGTENNIKFHADLAAGQKTGWFYDQRDNRTLLQKFCHKKSVLDCFSFTGSFGLYAKLAGAKDVTVVDASQKAIEIAGLNAELNNTQFDDCIVNDAFTALANFNANQFDVVVIDPPAFVKSKKDYNAGIRGYIKLVRLAQNIVKPQGILLFTSCSYHVNLDDIRQIIARSIPHRKVQLIKAVSAGFDHPMHPHLPESAYLKGFLVALD